QLDIDDIVSDVHTTVTGTSWLETTTGITHKMRLAGSFQARNGQMAIMAMHALGHQGFQITDDAIATGLMQARIPGKAEIINDVVHPTLDGAHNDEMVAALVRYVPSLLRSPRGKRPAVAGLLVAKQGDAMIKTLLPVP